MSRTIRFHLDEHCPTALADGLRRRGIDVTTAAEAGLLRAPDEDHVAFARTEGRVIFTHDADYIGIHQSGVEHAGIAYCHHTSRSLGQIIRMLVLMWEVMTPQEMRNRVEYV